MFIPAVAKFSWQPKRIQNESFCTFRFLTITKFIPVSLFPLFLWLHRQKCNNDNDKNVKITTKQQNFGLQREHEKWCLLYQYLCFHGHSWKEDLENASLGMLVINIIKWHPDFYGDAPLHTYVKTLIKWHPDCYGDAPLCSQISQRSDNFRVLALPIPSLSSYEPPLLLC